jgi:hypothetical protein
MGVQTHLERFRPWQVWIYSNGQSSLGNSRGNGHYKEIATLKQVGPSIAMGSSHRCMQRFGCQASSQAKSLSQKAVCYCSCDLPKVVSRIRPGMPISGKMMDVAAPSRPGRCVAPVVLIGCRSPFLINSGYLQRFPCNPCGGAD